MTTLTITPTLGWNLQIVNAASPVLVLQSAGANHLTFFSVGMQGPQGPSGSGSSAWGSITGTLGSQADLAAVLAGKQPLATVLTNTTASYTAAEQAKLAAITGTNTGDQTTIAGITGTKAQFNTAVSDGNFVFVNDAIALPNNTNITVGTTANVVLRHNGTDGFLETSSGRLNLRGRVEFLNAAGTETLAQFIPDDGVYFSFNNAVKLWTTNTGAEIFGNLVVSGNVDGRNVSTDGAKLDGIASGATANSSDAVLLARSNHTGTQLSATISDFATAVSGNAAVAANTAKVTNATHTGDVTGSTALTIAANAVTLSKMATLVTSTILGRATAGTGNVEALTPAQLRTMINVTDGATANASDASLRDRSTHTGTQPQSTVVLSGDLAALEALTGTNAIYYRSAADTWTAVVIGANLTFTGGTLAASGGVGATNLTYDAATRTVASDTGTDAVLTVADVTNAGLMTAANFTKLAAITGTNTGDQTSIAGITGTKAQFNTAVSDGDIQFVGDAPTAHTHLLAAGATDVTMTAANLNTLDDGVDTALHFHAADRARANHTGTQAAATIAGLAAVATSGSAADLGAGILPAARFDDTAHGARAGGTLHANAVAAGASGFMTGADKTKLDGVATGATANAADASLRDRATHTGTQLAATISDFSTAVAGTAAVAANTAKVTNATHTGDATGATALTLATVNGNVGSFGLAGSVAQFVVNAKGLITAAANVAISIASTAISDSTAAGRAFLTAATSAAQTALLDVFTAANKGLVPASGGGTVNFLRADGTFAAPGGGGVTNLAYDAATRVVSSDTGTDATLTLADLTNAGLGPARSGSATQYLDGTGVYSTPAGGGGGVTDGAKGDVIVSGGGTVWTLDPAVRYGMPIALQQNIFFN